MTDSTHSTSATVTSATLRRAATAVLAANRAKQTVTEGERHGWLVTPVAAAGVPVRLDAGVAVAGDSCGQHPYASAQASAVGSP
jgi:hypothetical protein